MKHSKTYRMVRLLCAAATILALCVIYSGTAPANAQEIRTPSPPPTPRINGPSIFGVRPGSPFLYQIPATGDRPMTFSVDNLPAGLQVNSSTGQITGSLNQTGEYVVTLRATNSLGSNQKNFRIVVGDTIGLTPAMGWNSWNCWGGTVTAARVQAAAEGMVSSGLINHGWSYINIDDAWQAPRSGQYNALQGNSNFPDMQGLCNQIHNLGLKVGIYSTPWVSSYAGYLGGSADNPQGTWPPGDNGHYLGMYSFATNDAQQWAAWGIDYLKYDWNPNQHNETVDMYNALHASGRDIIYSLSNSMPFANVADLSQYANCWRATGDITDNWSSMSSIRFNKDSWAPYSIPGHYNDYDMLVVGYVGWGSTQHPTGLTPDEQYTHITLWSLLSSPLLLGCDMTRLDEFTLNLLTNDEVLAVNQDPLGKQATCKSGGGTDLRVYAKDMEDGSKAVGLFNLGSTAATVTARWSDLSISGPQIVRDLWRQHDLGKFDTQFQTTVASHGAELVKIRPGTILKAWSPSPAKGAQNILQQTTLSWQPGEKVTDPNGHGVYLGTNETAVTNATTSSPEFRGTRTDPNYNAAPLLAANTTHYWRTDEYDPNGATYKGDVWSFATAGLKVSNPTPPNGPPSQNRDVDLSWSAGFKANSTLGHGVYFGTDQTDVNNATTSSPEYKGAQTATIYDPGTLLYNTTYYWRIDEYDPNTAIYQGDVWSFTTLPRTDPNLVGWWKLDETSGTTAFDSSGNGNHGTLINGPLWVTGKIGGGLQFDGSNDYVDTHNTTNLTRWTVCVWVTSPAAPSSASASGPVHRESNYQINWNHQAAAYRGAAAVQVGSWYPVSFGTLVANTWYHLAAIYDGETLKAYKDGILGASNASPSGNPNSEGNTLKFGRHTGLAQYFGGTIDDVRIYNKALTASQITAVATIPAAPTGLVPTAGGGYVSLDWSDNGESDLSYYNVKRSTSTGGPYSQIATDVMVSAYTDTGLTGGTTYYYVVTAVDTAHNESGNSNEASAMPSIPGDINGNGIVDFIDFSIFGKQWQRDGVSVPSADIAPAGGDKIVDFSDLKLLAENWLW